jgi:malonate transporter
MARNELGFIEQGLACGRSRTGRGRNEKDDSEERYSHHRRHPQREFRLYSAYTRRQVTTAVAIKLLAVLLTAALGYGAGRSRLLTHGAPGSDAARVLSNAALYVFVPALLFRTTARIDYANMPWRIITAYFVPVLTIAFLVYVWHHLRGRANVAAAVPATRALSVAFGNSVQLGIPMATALFGEEGLAIHIPLVSLHALILLSVLTALVELDLARAAHGNGTDFHSLRRALVTTVRNTVLHPVLLPVLAGVAWHLLGLPIPAALDEVLVLLGSAVVPLCLVLIGVSLAQYGIKGHLHGAALATVGKLLVVPAAVLVVARFGFGLTGLNLAVLVMMAALPVGTNALLFAQRYGVLEAEATAAIVASTVAFVVTAGLWLAVLAALAPS